MRVKALLTEAADRIEKYGLLKGDVFTYYEEDNGEPVRNLSGPCCTLGALDQARLDLGTTRAVLHDATIAIQEELPSSFHLSIAVWNDMPERTKDEVVALLRKVADEQT